MNRIAKFLACFAVLFALVACLFIGNVSAFPTHKGLYRFNELCEKVKKGDWKNFRFHVWLTLKAIELVEKHRGIKIPDELRWEIIIGSFEEDYDMQGTANCARYNAIGNEAILTDIASIRCENHFYCYPGDKQGLTYGFGVETGLNVSALVWATNSPYNNYDAQDGYEAGFSKKFFRVLGHVLHLLQDTGCPAHARNEKHRSETDYYESMLLAKDFKDYDDVSVEFPTVPEIAGNTVQSYFDTLQKFTGRNFFSNDTMFTNFHEGVNLPFDGISS